VAQAFFEGLRASPDSLAPFLFMLNLLGNKAAGEGLACGLSCTRSIWTTAGLASVAWRVAARVWLFDGAARLAFRLEKRWSAAHICDMGAGWKFVGEFKRGRKASLSLECIVALSDRRAAEGIASKKLVGADTITATELSQAELNTLNIMEGDVRL
jgi:hypothetical protein